MGEFTRIAAAEVTNSGGGLPYRCGSLADRAGWIGDQPGAQINLTLSMAFLAPPLVKAAIEGRLPRGIGIADLRDAPPQWSKQYTKLGLPAL